MANMSKMKGFSLAVSAMLAIAFTITLSVNAVAQETVAVDTSQAKSEVKEKIDTAEIMKKRYGVRAGVNWSSMGYRSATGFQIGGAAEMPLSLVDIRGYPYTIDFQPSVMFASKGGKMGRVYNYLYSYYSYTISAYYLQASAPFSFGRAFSKNFAARLEFGPYFAIGLFGTLEGPYINESAFSDAGLSRFDAGLHSGASLEFFERKYYLGMHNSSGFTDDNISAFYITLGYNF